MTMLRQTMMAAAFVLAGATAQAQQAPAPAAAAAPAAVISESHLAAAATW